MIMILRTFLALVHLIPPPTQYSSGIKQELPLTESPISRIISSIAPVFTQRLNVNLAELLLPKCTAKKLFHFTLFSKI